RPELQLLHMLGLFNRVAADDELAVLRELPVRQGLNEQVAYMTRSDFAYTLGSLRRAGLIQNMAAGEGIDAHPLVREYFQRNFRRYDREAFQEGHRRLRNLLAAKASRRPRNLDECVPVIAAIWHGTRAGDNVEALDDLYDPRLSQDHHFLRDGLGAAASNHAALTYLLEDTGGQPLTDEQTSRLLADQSLDLRMMGNTAEAVFPLAQAIRLTRSLGESTILVNQLRHLSQLELALGKMDQACQHSEEAQRICVDQRIRGLESLSARTSCAFALLHAGRYGEAMQFLDQIDLLAPNAVEEVTRYASRVTFCIAVYRTVDTLLGLDSVEPQGSRSVSGTRRGTDLDADALQVARKAVESSEAKPDLLGAALLELASARVLLQVNPDDATIGRLTQAVEDIHTVGQRPWIIEANLV